MIAKQDIRNHHRFSDADAELLKEFHLLVAECLIHQPMI